MNDSRCRSSSIEARVQVAITGHCRTPPEGGTYYHWRRDSLPQHFCTHVQEREHAYLSDNFSSTYMWCPQVGENNSVSRKRCLFGTKGGGLGGQWEEILAAGDKASPFGMHFPVDTVVTGESGECIGFESINRRLYIRAFFKNQSCLPIELLQPLRWHSTGIN
ncbi:hypothetical protein AVEN_184659-1 [Araneus ventricosus]|uniref:Uncharacterized protein n=1 Tax=Araneus ventricosus TaxID=182803 RepID=A0A4Y2G3K8_ARAVE|nr:hypothetical protein AVEN_184659-1 [Araneus ventricosus]